MRLFQREWVTAMLLVGLAQSTIVTVDDSDTAIEYHGTWVRKTLGGLVGADFEHSFMFTNTSGSTATYKFQGTVIALYGMFEKTDVSNINSSYSIDGVNSTNFTSVQSTASTKYRQKLFQSDTLSDEGHTLVITTGGQDFALNYLIIMQSPPSTATTVSIPETPLPSTTEPSLPIHPATAGLASSTGSVSQPHTSTVASGVQSPTSTFAGIHSTKLPASEVAGFSIAVILALIVAGLTGYTWRRRREGRVQRRDDVVLYDPSLTTLAFNTSGKPNLMRDHNSEGSAANTVLPLSLSESAPAYPQPTLDMRTLKSTREGGESHEISATNLGPSRRTLFELSPDSPLADARTVPQQARQKDAPIPTSAGPSCTVVRCGERRRSVDGGVRLAGGPLDDEWQNHSSFDDQEDMDSGVSTLPPAYRVYTYS